MTLHHTSKRSQSVAVAGLTALMMSSLHAQPTSAPAATQPSETFTVSAAEMKHLERQAVVALTRVGAALDANPPGTTVSTERALALNLFDAILHEPAAPKRPAIGAFRLARTQQAIEEMCRTTITDDSAIVWQIYNMGFVVRTKSVTLGFDLVRLTHVPSIAIDEPTIAAIVEQCDVLFVSHEHLDHADRDVARLFLASGKPVIAPHTMWAGEPVHSQLTRLPRDSKSHAFPVQGGKATLDITTYPGFQRTKDGVDVENNVYSVATPEGIRIAHTGDNNVIEGLPTANAGGTRVDLLLMKLEPGTVTSRQVINAFSPRLTLPSHFEELGHVNVNAREPFWRGIERTEKLRTPSVLLMWGEHYRYTPPTSR